jgi:hypothetical protein
MQGKKKCPNRQPLANLCAARFFLLWGIVFFLQIRIRVGFFTLQHGEELFLCARGRSGFFHIACMSPRQIGSERHLFVFAPSCRERHDYINF